MTIHPSFFSPFSFTLAFSAGCRAPVFDSTLDSALLCAHPSLSPPMLALGGAERGPLLGDVRGSAGVVRRGSIVRRTLERAFPPPTPPKGILIRFGGLATAELGRGRRCMVVVLAIAASGTEPRRKVGENGSITGGGRSSTVLAAEAAARRERKDGRRTTVAAA